MRDAALARSAPRGLHTSQRWTLLDARSGFSAGAIAYPLEHRALLAPAHESCDESRPLSPDLKRIASARQEPPVLVPGRRERLTGIVK